MSKVTNVSRVLGYLKTGHSLDLPKALALWGHIRLSDVIFKLRKRGYSITTDIIKAPSGAEFAIYKLSTAVTKDTPCGKHVKVKVITPESTFFGQVGYVSEISSDLVFPVEVVLPDGVQCPYGFRELERVYE